MEVSLLEDFLNYGKFVLEGWVIISTFIIIIYIYINIGEILNIFIITI